MTSANGPLAGLRALDLIEGLGAYGPWLMARLGAEVVKVEPPGGSAQRRTSPYYRGGPESLHFLHYNAGKRSVTLDLRAPASRERLRSLLDRVDIVFDNGSLRAAGFDLLALSEKTPALVVVSVTPFGLDGPRADWAGDDLVCQAMSGMISYYGYRDERPARFGPHQASEMSGLAAVLGGLIALYDAGRSGKGDLVDISAERVGALVTFQMSNASLYHQFGFRRQRHERGANPEAGPYMARDGYVQMGAFRSLDPLLEVLERSGAVEGLPEIVAELPEGQFARDPRVQAAIREFIAARSRAEVVEAVQGQGTICVPINDMKDLVDDPFLQERGFFTEVELPGKGMVEDVGIPIRFGTSAIKAGGRAPAPGEHTDEVLRLLDQPRLAPPPTASAVIPPRPLEGVRVVDASWIIAGPLSTRLLSDYGAEVIKVESTTRPDVARGNRSPLFGQLPGDANSNADTGGYFQDSNAGKLSCTLNLTVPQGRELLRKLVAVSDAIVCNLHGDQLDRWGVGWEEARKLNPRIVVVTVPTMETHGPRTRWRAFGDSFAAMSGIKSISGHPGDTPVNFGHQYPDFSANPFHAAIAVIAALQERDRTGEGQFVEVSQYESTACLVGPAMLAYTANGEVPGPSGNRNPDAAPHNIYRCMGEDSWCAISVLNDEQWRALTAIDGLEALRRADLAILEGRKSHEDEIDATIEAWTLRWERQDLAAFLQQRGVPAGPYQDIVDVVERDPTLDGRYFVKRMHPVGREFLVHGSPMQLRRNVAGVRLGPLLGEHTMDVLERVLGLTPDEIAEYAAAGALD